MSRSLRNGIFVGIAFLLGSINVLYHSVFYALLVVALVLNLIADWNGFWQEARRHRNYLLLPVIGVIYLCIHYLLSLCWGGLPYKASWSTVELLMLYFFFIPVYVVSMKKWITVSLLKCFLLALCWGILVFNAVKFFYITGTGIFTDFSGTLQMIYATRFGSNMELLKGFVLLEPQAFYLTVSGIVSYFYLLHCVWVRTGRATFISCLIIFIFYSHQGFYTGFWCRFLSVVGRVFMEVFVPATDYFSGRDFIFTYFCLLGGTCIFQIAYAGNESGYRDIGGRRNPCGRYCCSPDGYVD